MRVHTDRVGQRRFCHSRSAFHHLYRSHRNSRRIWPAHLSGSLEPGLESRANEGCHGRWRRMDLEPSRSALSRRGADRRSLPRSPAPVEPCPQTVSQRSGRAASLDEGPPEAASRQGQDRKAGPFVALYQIHQYRSYGKDSHRGRLLRAQRRAYALPKVSPSAPVHWFRGDRSWLQNRNRFPPKAIWHVLDDSRCQRHHRLEMLPSQRPLRNLLGGASGCMTSTFMSRTRRRVPGDWMSYGRLLDELMRNFENPPSAPPAAEAQLRVRLFLRYTVDCLQQAFRL